MFTQLTLDLQLKEYFTFDNFVSGDNEILIELLKNKNTNIEKQVYFWGQHNSGKSHLLQALCQLHATNNLTISYLPMKQVLDYSPDIFQGQENMDICCIDDVQLLQHKVDWQEALFNLINRFRETGKRLIVSANQPPTDIHIGLKDLVSRLQWGPVFCLNELTDNEKCQAMKLRAESRGFELTDNVAGYLLNNCNRDLADLFTVLDTLDQAQLQLHRRLTIPFVKAVLA